MSAPVSRSDFQAAMSILCHVYVAPLLGRLIGRECLISSTAARSTRENEPARQVFIRCPSLERCVR